MSDISPSVSATALEKDLLQGTDEVEKPMSSPVTQSSTSTSLYPSRVILTSNKSFFINVITLIAH